MVQQPQPSLLFQVLSLGLEGLQPCCSAACSMQEPSVSATSCTHRVATAAPALRGCQPTLQQRAGLITHEAAKSLPLKILLSFLFTF